MNEKTAKLLRKYAATTDAELNGLKRRWNDMNHVERRAFRLEMRAAVALAAESSDEEEAADQEEAQV